MVSQEVGYYDNEGDGSGSTCKEDESDSSSKQSKDGKDSEDGKSPKSGGRRTDESSESDEETLNKQSKQNPFASEKYPPDIPAGVHVLGSNSVYIRTVETRSSPLHRFPGPIGYDYHAINPGFNRTWIRY